MPRSTDLRWAGNVVTESELQKTWIRTGAARRALCASTAGAARRPAPLRPSAVCHWEKHTAPAMQILDLYKICNLSRNTGGLRLRQHIKGKCALGHEFTIPCIGAAQGPTLAGGTGAGSQTHAELEDCGAMLKCC